MMRALRPDRMTYAVQSFVEEKLGPKYVENRSVEFAKSFEESGKRIVGTTFKTILFFLEMESVLVEVSQSE